MPAKISMGDAPGTLREFETIYILKADTGEEQIGQLNQRIRGLIEESGGKLLKLDNWGKRRLAYEIAKERKGIYLLWRYLAPGSLVYEVERQLRLQDVVLRQMTVHVGKDVRPDLRQSDVDEQRFTEASRVGPDEEELMTGQSERVGELDAAEADEGEGEGAVDATARPEGQGESHSSGSDEGKSEE